MSSFSEDRGFNSEIFECMDRILSSTFGDATKQAIYHMLEAKFGATQSQMRSKPLELAAHLHEVLGEIGFPVVEKLMIREIRRTFGLTDYDSATLDRVFADARAKFLGGGSLRFFSKMPELLERTFGTRISFSF